MDGIIGWITMGVKIYILKRYLRWKHRHVLHFIEEKDFRRVSNIKLPDVE